MKVKKKYSRSIPYILGGIILGFITILGINKKIPLPWEGHKRTENYILHMKDEMKKIFMQNEQVFIEVADAYSKLTPYTSCSVNHIPEEIMNNPILLDKINYIFNTLEFEKISSCYEGNEWKKLVVVFTKESGYKYEMGITYNGVILGSLAEPYSISKNWYYRAYIGYAPFYKIPSEMVKE